MNQQQVLSRALNTLNYKKDVAETGCVRERNPSAILGKAQDSLYTSKTGIRRLLGVGGGSSKEIAATISLPEEPETMEIAEPTRQFSSAEDVAARVAKIRRGSMTTYTVNLAGAAGNQVGREARRLAGLAPAFTRPSGNAINPEGAAPIPLQGPHGPSFDAVEEMMGGAGAGDGDGGDPSSGCGCGQSPSPPSPPLSLLYSGGGAGNVRGGVPAAAGRGPIRPAFGAASATEPCRLSVSGGDVANPRPSIELADVTTLQSNLSNVGNISGPDGRSPPPGVQAAFGRSPRTPSQPQAFLGFGGATSAAAAVMASAASASAASGSTGAGLSLSPVTSTSSSFLSGQLGLMRDRKVASRHGTHDGYSPPPTASPGGAMNCPPQATSGGAAAASAGVAAPAVASAWGISVLKLPTLPPTSGRGVSGSQISSALSTFTPATSNIAAAAASGVGVGGGNGAPGAAAATSAADAPRPSSSRLALGRGNTTSSILTLPDRRISVENIDLGAAITNVLGNNYGGGGGGSALARAATDGGPSFGGAPGGRWFQCDSTDVEAMWGGAQEELLERLMVAGMSHSSSGVTAATAGGPGGSPGRTTSCGGDGSGPGGEPGLLLPRLAESAWGPRDRATAQLQELWRVQANVEDQLNRERQAMAAGKVRRASVLEDVAGQHQPRWQVSYNVDAPVTHAKLGTVDASRRSELDRAHLTKLVKEQRATPAAAPAAAAVPAAAVSPVVARARRLSTVLVA